MRMFLALLVARNKEFYRDRSSLVWTMAFPVLLIAGFAFAFSTPETSIFKIGALTELKGLPTYIETVKYDDDTQAMQRLDHHQVDLVIDHNTQQIWYNELSPGSLALRDIAATSFAQGYTQQSRSGEAVRYVEWAMPGVLGMNMMFAAFFGVGYVIVRYRKNGVLKRLSASPVSPLVFLSAQLASRFTIVLVANGTILVACMWLLSLRMEGSWSALIAVMSMGCICMLSIGLAVASRVNSEELAGGLLNLLTWPMMMLSELWFSLDNSPEWMQSFANLLPLTHMVKATREIMIDGAGWADVLPNIVVLAAFAICSLLLAASLFRWEGQN